MKKGVCVDYDGLRCVCVGHRPCAERVSNRRRVSAIYMRRMRPMRLLIQTRSPGREMLKTSLLQKIALLYPAAVLILKTEEEEKEEGEPWLAG